MKKYIFVALGGMLGALARFGIKQIGTATAISSFPFDTLLINIIGSLLLAFILTLSIETIYLQQDLKAGITVGFLGGFTTFSTFCKEAVVLMMQQQYMGAIAYIVLSAGLGLIAAYAGMGWAKKITQKKVRQ